MAYELECKNFHPTRSKFDFIILNTISLDPCSFWRVSYYKRFLDIFLQIDTCRTVENVIFTVQIYTCRTVPKCFWQVWNVQNVSDCTNFLVTRIKPYTIFVPRMKVWSPSCDTCNTVGTFHLPVSTLTRVVLCKKSGYRCHTVQNHIWHVSDETNFLLTPVKIAVCQGVQILL